MKGFFLRSISFMILFCTLAIGLYAQQNRFIYIQTENKQPFYIKMDKRIISSSVAGHIIIPRLTDSTYLVSFGFPKNEWPGQNVTISIKGTDAGYLLQNTAERGWGLIDLQTLQVLIPAKTTENKNVIEMETREDEFSTILASVVNDPSIAKKIRVKSDTLVTSDLTETKTAEQPLLNEERKPVLVKGEITKLKYDVGKDGINIIYLDWVNGISDTIHLLIPAVEFINNAPPGIQAQQMKQAKGNNEAKTREDRFMDMELQNPNSGSDTDHISDQVITKKKTSYEEKGKAEKDSTGKKIKEPATNSKCTYFASYEDFTSLRKVMALEESYENMIKVARKNFKLTCYTTDQIKNLGSMFLNDEGKYKFYAMAYPYVSDSQNFGTLENQLSDRSVITKFRTILH